ncbi:hypothetical protein SUNI508_13551 [Seiridium unicorne]|uniref:CFEM domain-containing protein n=1 Tax=Seiridium unicorne TaxID=138068 RepID=A0ABR2VDU9_9PEZI
MMKWFIVLSALIGAALAQNCAAVAVTAVPVCAQSCILNGATSIGCSGTDFACQCEKEAALYAAIEGCVSSGCPEPSYQAVIDGASSVCNCATGALVATTTNSQVATTTAATTSAASSTNTVINYNTYTSRTSLTPTATVNGAAPTNGATLGLMGGVVIVAAML